ncbi:MAG: magnesium transporter CorA family protein [Promethearchaeota archaeon]
MKINYFFITDEVHGRPIIEITTSDLEGLKTEYHPAKLTQHYAYSFLDIELEDLSDSIEDNIEALKLKEILDIPQDTIEEIIADQRPRADRYQEFYMILFKNFSLEVRDVLESDKREEYIEFIEEHIHNKNIEKELNLMSKKKIKINKEINQEITKEINKDMAIKNEYYDFMIKERMFKLIEHQIGIIIRGNIVISIHKAAAGLELSELFKRFQKYPLKMSRGGVTYFVTTYIDMLIDSIYQVLDVWTRSINIYEREIVKDPKKSMVFDILTLRHRLLDLIKILQADREIITNIRGGTIKSFRVSEIPPELDDHIKHLLDETDIIRALLQQILKLYYAAQSVKLDESTKRFTGIFSIFLLPTLIADIFGMNNYPDNMPGFYFTIFLMIVSVSLLLMFFKYKKYI